MDLCEIRRTSGVVTKEVEISTKIKAGNKRKRRFINHFQGPFRDAEIVISIPDKKKKFATATPPRLRPGRNGTIGSGLPLNKGSEWEPKTNTAKIIL
jgi:hypothetical protein